MKKLLIVLFASVFLFGCSSDSGQSGGTSTSQKAENGDIVKIDFVGKLNGVAFQGGTASGAVLELGSKTYIDGFEEQVVGMKKGDEKTIKVTFPANYGSSDLAGKEVTFDIKLNKLYREVK